MQRLEHTGRRTRFRRTFEADAVDRVAVRAGDEPLLEREAPVRRVEPRAQPLVGRGQDRGLETERGGEPRRDGRERRAFPQRLRAHDVQPEVAVAEAKPRLAAE